MNGNLPNHRCIVDEAINLMEPLSRVFYSTLEIRALLEQQAQTSADMLIYGQQRFTFFQGEWHPVDSEAFPEHMRTPFNTETNPIYVTVPASAPVEERQP